MKFKVNKYADILWMDDFDTNSSDPIDIEAGEDEDYVSEEDVDGLFHDMNHYKFRLHPFKYVKQTLDELENNFFQYSCAILDINMKEGFVFRGEDNFKEYTEIETILKSANVQIREEHKWPDGYKAFKKNAGYYIYLYLLQRGMPSNRIAIFTGNKGEATNSSIQTDNLTDEWEKNFEAAGFIPPDSFAKQTEKEELSKWIETKMDNSYRLRSCMVIMSTYILEALNNCKSSEIFYTAFKINDDKKKKDFLEDAKLILQDLQNTPLRLPKTESEISSIFNSLINKIAHPWEAIEEKNIEKKEIPYAYWTTMHMTRNWLAHDIIKDDNHKSGFKYLWVMAFLFGVGMRGMFNFDKLLKYEGTDRYYEYCKWEDELLALIQERYPQQKMTISDSDAEQKVELFRKLILRSYNELHIRSKKLEYGVLSLNIGGLISEIGNQKNGIPCNEMDLLRDFLHGITLLYANRPKGQDQNQCGIYNFVIHVDYRTLAQYYYYLCKKDYPTPKKNRPIDKDNFNLNREWDYVESILGHIENELSR